jgi:hypothetical protein
MSAIEAARPLTDVQQSPHSDPRVRQLAPIAIKEFSEQLAIPVKKYWSDMGAVLDESNAPDAEQRALDREVMYCDNVYGTVLEVAKLHDGPITVLEDVDQTMVETKHVKRVDRFTNKAVYVIESVVRPGVSAVTTKIMNNRKLRNRVGRGVLTARPAQEWEGADRAQRAPYITAFSGLGEEAFYISTGDKHRHNKEMRDLQRNGTVEQKLDAIKAVIDPDIAEKIRADAEKIRSDEISAKDLAYTEGDWFDVRMVELAELLEDERYKDHAFVYVDDLPFAKVIRKDNKRLRGVCVGSTVQDETRRNALQERAKTLRAQGFWN